MGIGLARALSAKVGSRLTLLANTLGGSYNGIDVTVVGIFHSGMKDVDDSYFRIQRQAAGQLLDTTSVESIAVGLAADDGWEYFAREATRLFPELEATSFAVLDKVYYQHAVDWLGQQMLFIQAIVLLIITIGIANTVSFTIIERTLEIGNLRANGESTGEILALLLWEGLAIGLIGASLGIGLAYFVNLVVIPNGVLMPPAPGLTRQFNVKVELRPFMILVTTAMGVLVTLVATLIAASGKIKRPIAELLRHR
jgi:putative ABC transport system permease protein